MLLIRVIRSNPPLPGAPRPARSPARNWNSEPPGAKQFQVAACCRECVQKMKSSVSLADELWETLENAPKAPGPSVHPRSPARRPDVDVRAGVDAASNSSSGSDLVLKGWHALSQEQQHGIIGGASGFAGLVVLLIAGGMYFYGTERGKRQKESVLAFCDRHLPGRRP